MRTSPVTQSLVGVLVVVVLLLGVLFMAPTGSPAYADPTEPPGPTPAIASCTIVKQAGVNIQFECVDGLGNTIPAGQITVEPQVIVSEIIKNIPGPTVTATVRVPGPVRTHRVTIRPAPIVKTIRPPQVTVTKTLAPKPRPTRTVTATATETIVNEVTRQPTPESGRVEDNEPDRGFFTPDVNFGDNNITAGEAGIGLLSALLIIVMIMSGMGYGFRRGLKAGESGESDFLRTLLDRSKTT